MADTTFISKKTTIPTAWLQDLNDLFYKGTKALTVTGLTVSTSGITVTGNSTIVGTLTGLTGLTVTGSVTITGAVTGITTLAGTLTTAAQPNVTSVGGTITIGTGTVPTSGSVRITTSGTGIVQRSTISNLDSLLLSDATINAISNIVLVGGGINTTGVVLQSRSGGAAPTASDLTAGNWAVWRDTVGNTTKLYYNNAGAIQSVALV